MFGKLFNFHHQVRRRWLYPVISVVVAVSIGLANVVPAQANINRWLPSIIRGVQVYQLSNISPRQEIELGRQMNDQIRQNMRFVRDPNINEYVRQIGQRLVSQSERPDYPFTFQVVDNNTINAFATTGGFVYLHSGLIKSVENEAELASVLGHEIGHITGRHLIGQLRQRAIASGVASAAGIDRNTAVSLGVELALNLPRSRQDEFDADRRGLRMLSKAGYAQSAMISFMQTLQRRSPSIPAFLSTHPPMRDRIAALQRLINSEPTIGQDGLNTSQYRARISNL
ncbi:M48 family metallopeptidase [Calothrix sp. NIES-3974]|uniref:M48 family metallopeptidase n=1 Tax=Calothrix sp. NIES-3974 TaxID=2005462 RepID=UPI000BBC5340